jgi:hypothetical protein
MQPAAAPQMQMPPAPEGEPSDEPSPEGGQKPEEE